MHVSIGKLKLALIYFHKLLFYLMSCYSIRFDVISIALVYFYERSFLFIRLLFTLLRKALVFVLQLVMLAAGFANLRSRVVHNTLFYFKITHSVSLSVTFAPRGAQAFVLVR